MKKDTNKQKKATKKTVNRYSPAITTTLPPDTLKKIEKLKSKVDKPCRPRVIEVAVDLMYDKHFKTK